MRMRLTDAATREQTNIEVRRSSDASRRFNDGTSTSGAPFSSAPSREKPPTGSATGDRSTTPSRATAVQQRRASVGSSSTPSGGGRDAVGADLAPPRRSSTFTQQQSQQQHQEQSQGQQISGLPGPLSSATNDLQDVINALGVGPLHLGLGVNPRSSVVSGAYTHNTSGRGSTMDRENLMSLGEASTSSGEGGSGGGAEVSSVEKRFKSLVSTALKSPVRQRRL